MVKFSKFIAYPELLDKAIKSVRAWERKDTDNVICPVCGAANLDVVDQSARPHTLWFALSCNACGLDEAICIPGAAHSSDHDG